MNTIASWIGKYCLIVALLGTAITDITVSEVAAQGLISFPAATKQHSLAKRMDLEMCLVSFDVHPNTIIRTEESRSMGATFLDDADVNSREQCLRLCCETENCDVFVFEEKNQGTCFLFNCGPPSNFYCKFTHHSNYTSAVLKLPPTVSEVEQQPPPPPVQPLVSQIHSLAAAHAQPPPPATVIVPKLSQHELELVNLKGPKAPARSNSDQPTTTLIPPLGVQLGQQTTTTSSTPRPSTPAQCGHYEFPCHSGECIAVYNACDGIPQCADGSDEGPECRRPAPPPPVKAVQSIPLQQQMLQRPAMPQMPVEQMNPVPMPKQVFQQDLQQQELRGLQQIHNREDPMTAPKPWPRPIGEMPPSYIDTPDSRIFNHKGGLQIQSNISPPQYPDSIPDTSYIPNIPRTNQYMPLPGSYQSGPPQKQWDPRMSPPQRPMWPQQIPQSIQGSLPQQPNQPQQQQLQPIATPAVSDQSKQPVEVPKESSPSESHKSQKSSEEYESYDDQQYQESSKAATSGEDQEDQEKPVVEKPEQKKKQHKHRKHGGDHGDHGEHKKKNKSNKTTKKDKAHDKEDGHSEHAAPPVHEHLKMLRSDLEIEFADHDGQAERPGGAVLSLTLGAILTAALAIMIGCRMKVARRRIRRQGKSSYAHDADFLVNGMYL